ncbi:MAG: hypothetical protein OXU20_16825 [Myxococcales bacterium]|nr:hypothetical protein [Myxococcales bacterium]MDD9971187.1 hypothetical protein [Myxococcales bacterium]
MNINVLIDSLVRQTTVLIAQLATAAGARAPLAHTANQVFFDLVTELKEQGLGNKVIADMFGMALRTYHSRMQRLAESHTFRGRSLWEAVLEHLQEKETVLRSEVMQRFRNDDQATVASVLKDLVETGMVFQSGRGDRITYRAATPEEYTLADGSSADEGLSQLVWVAANRLSPATLAELQQAVPVDASSLQTALAELVQDGRIEVCKDGGCTRYVCERCVIPVGSSVGWEAAVYDHYQAVVTALCSKLRSGSLEARHGEAIGGSTYAYDVWPEHPQYREVLALLGDARARAVALSKKVEAYNRTHSAPDPAYTRVIHYVGQTVLDPELGGE